MRRVFGIILCAATVCAATLSVAQSPFSTAIEVNDRAISYYEIDQREKLLRLLRAPGNPATEARKGLIEDRLKIELAESAGFRIDDANMIIAMEDFAGRANLSLDEFTQTLNASGVDQETLREFVRSGVSWRDYIRTRFGPRAQITDAEVDRALNTSGGSGGLRVLLSEIIMPAPPREAAVVNARAQRISQLTSTSAFSAQARKYSATRSRDNGGRLPWTDLNELPPVLQGIVLSLKPGEVSSPLNIPNAVALFQLRDIEEVASVAPPSAAIEYAALYIAGGRSEAGLKEAARIEARVDTCDDLYGVAKDLPPEQLERGALPPADIPEDIAIELAKLDAGEVSTTLTRSNGETLVFLMLCGRTPSLGDGGEVDREAIRNQLRTKRLESFANGLIAQLRADAIIVEN